MVGLVGAGIFSWVIQPVARFLWLSLSSLSGQLYHSLSDSIYQAAALGAIDRIPLEILSYFTSAIAGVWSGTLTGLLRSRRPKKQKENLDYVKKGNLRLTLFCLVSISLPILTAVSASHFITYSLTKSFQQRFTILAPKLSDQDEEELLARWASMKNGVDHEKLCLYMDSLAQQHNIILPRPLWK